MNDLTFWKDSLILLTLIAAVALHAAAAACGFFVKKLEMSKILNTGCTVANILLHIFLIFLMMYRGIKIEEAVLVMLISVFMHTLLWFVYHTVASRRGKTGGCDR